MELVDVTVAVLVTLGTPELAQLPQGPLPPEPWYQAGYQAGKTFFVIIAGSVIVAILIKVFFGE
jgi:hypothetical protein